MLKPVHEYEELEVMGEIAAGNQSYRSRPGTLAERKPPSRAGTNEAQINYKQILHKNHRPAKPIHHHHSRR